jgi:hypothetical protein
MVMVTAVWCSLHVAHDFRAARRPPPVAISVWPSIKSSSRHFPTLDLQK